MLTLESEQQCKYSCDNTVLSSYVATFDRIAENKYCAQDARVTAATETSTQTECAAAALRQESCGDGLGYFSHTGQCGGCRCCTASDANSSFMTNYQYVHNLARWVKVASDGAELGTSYQELSTGQYCREETHLSDEWLSKEECGRLVATNPVCAAGSGAYKHTGECMEGCSCCSSIAYADDVITDAAFNMYKAVTATKNQKSICSAYQFEGTTCKLFIDADQQGLGTGSEVCHVRGQAD